MKYGNNISIIMIKTKIHRKDHESLSQSQQQRQQDHHNVDPSASKYNLSTCLIALIVIVVSLTIYTEYHKLNYTSLPQRERYEIKMSNYLYRLRWNLWELVNHRNNYQLDLNKQDSDRIKGPYSRMKFFKSEDELPFCLIMPIYHSFPFYVLQHSLNSIFRQNYSNYRVVLSRPSLEDTHLYIKAYLQAQNISQTKYVFMESLQATALGNIDKAVHNYCQNQSYIMIVQGGHAFMNREVLKTFSLTFMKSHSALIIADHAKVSIHRDYVRNYRVSLPSRSQINDLDLKGRLNYRLFSFRLQVYKEINPIDLKNDSGQYFNDFTAPLLVPLLQLCCKSRMRLAGGNFIEFIGEDNNQRKIREWEALDSLRQRKKMYECSKYMTSKKAENLKGLQYVEEKRTQKEVAVKKITKEAEITDFLQVNSEGKTILDVMYPSESEKRQRETYHRERTQFINKKGNNFHGLSLINYNIKLDDSSDQQQALDEAKEYQRLHQKYRIGDYPSELAMCLVICGYNNNAKNRIQYILNSIFRQNYTNYFAVILDDASDDGSDIAIRRYLNFYNVSKDRYVYILNKQRKTALENIYNIVNDYCSSDSIALTIDMDDELIGKNVFKLFNSFYHRLKGGFIYSNFYQYSPLEIILYGNSRAYEYQEKKAVNFRSIPVKGVQIRSFNSSLFQSIPKSNFLDENGLFYTMTYDVSIVIPLKERACGRVYYIPEFHYLYNYQTGLNDGEVDEKLQLSIPKQIRKKKKLDCDPYYQTVPIYRDP